jgi:hypothetical protein
VSVSAGVGVVHTIATLIRRTVIVPEIVDISAQLRSTVPEVASWAFEATGHRAKKGQRHLWEALVLVRRPRR